MVVRFETSLSTTLTSLSGKKVTLFDSNYQPEIVNSKHVDLKAQFQNSADQVMNSDVAYSPNTIFKEAITSKIKKRLFL